MSIKDRVAQRVPIRLEVDFEHESTGHLTLVTRDISDSGIFIKLPVENYPPLGATANVKLKDNFENGEDPPVLKMKVVRHSSSGIGLTFIF